ncbi:DUF309 domain-containing protein [Halosegnis sp.]|uniref:DUF309 domain-containing protein n=1 Tax=Halosegnis sp. TaxID=2864959 RepID=UPI0035D43BC3
MDVPLEARLTAGMAVFNAGHYHAAHDAWEPPYREATGERRDFLQGLIQYAAAVHHVETDNREGAQGLAESALAYLDDVDPRGLALEPVRAWLRACRGEYDTVAGEQPPPLVRDGTQPALATLEYPAAAVAAPLVADATGHDAELLATAAEYALADLAAAEVGSPFVTLVLDFLAGEHRAIILERLAQHVQRRQAREADVEGLFD